MAHHVPGLSSQPRDFPPDSPQRRASESSCKAQYTTHWPAVICFAVLAALIAGGLCIPVWSHVARTIARASLEKTRTAKAAASARQLRLRMPAQDPASPKTAPPTQATVPAAIVTPAATYEAAEEAAEHARSQSDSPAVAVDSPSAEPRAAAAVDVVVAEPAAKDEIKIVEPWEKPLPRPDLAIDLVVDLDRRAVDLDLLAEPGAAQELLRAAPAVRDRAALLELLSRRNDLAGLPIRGENECQIDPIKARAMQSVSVAMRRLTARRVATQQRTASSKFSFSESLSFSESDAADKATLAALEKSLSDTSASTMAQMLQVESEGVRRAFVWRLGFSAGPESSIALADRALFDLSDEVRSAAIEVLRNRPPHDYQQRLVDGLRYPWPPVAEHAADALAKIGDATAIERIAPLVGEPDPSLPRLNAEKKWVVRELVRVNHLRNCLLCHAPSAAKSDLVRGLIPTPGKPIPVAYYQSAKGDFVHADTIYLRQDFSVMHKVANARPWPDQQRFDYFVRTRELKADEVAALEPRDPICRVTYPQRESVLAALHALESKSQSPAAGDRVDRH